MANPADDVAYANAEALRDWGLAQAANLWRRVRAAQVMESWSTVAPALLAVHTALVGRALDNVDLWMQTRAAAAGFWYDTRWTDDAPDRPTRVYWGAPAAPTLARAPRIVLGELAADADPEVALLKGWNFLSGIYRSEAHMVLRQQTLARVG